MRKLHVGINNNVIYTTASTDEMEKDYVIIKSEDGYKNDLFSLDFSGIKFILEQYVILYSISLSDQDYLVIKDKYIIIDYKLEVFTQKSFFTINIDKDKYIELIKNYTVVNETLFDLLLYLYHNKILRNFNLFIR